MTATVAASPTETLKELCGRRSLQAIYIQGYNESSAFNRALRAQWDVYGGGNRDGLMGAFDMLAAKALVQNVFPVVDPNNKAEAFMLCNAMVNVDQASGGDFKTIGNGGKPEWYTNAPSPHHEISGRTRYVFETAAKQFKGTVLGSYCTQALGAMRGQTGALFLYGI